MVESKAHKWLLSQGYKPDDIKFHRTRSPDFETKQGIGYEVKLNVGIKKPAIIFNKPQWETLNNHPNCIILVFNKNNDIPEVIPLNNLKEWKGHVTVQDYEIIFIGLPPAEKEMIKRAAAYEHRSVSQWGRLALVKLAQDINRLPPEI